MKRPLQIIAFVSLILFSVVLFFNLITTRVIFNNYKYDNLRSFAYKLNDEFPASFSNDKYIQNVSYKLEENNYKIFITFKSENNIVNVKIDNSVYPLNHYEDNTYYFYFEPIFFSHTTERTYYINTLIKETDLIETNYQFTLYKDIDPSVIENKMKSLVGVSLGRTWGSGIILNKKEIIKKNLFKKEVKLYEYIILTAEHVIRQNLKISIHYNNTYNTYGDVKVLGVYTENSDLAFLKLTTKDSSLVPLNDLQFKSDTPTNYKENDIVFLVGSPMNKVIDFNKVNSGYIVGVNELITLNGEEKLAIKTNASLTGGSSGGGLFNSSGDLIGLHFAGESKTSYSYSIPIEIILQAKDLILDENLEFGSSYTKKASDWMLLFL